MLIFSLGFFCVSLISAHQQFSYNSDDVSWQVILAHWKPFSGETVSLGSSDNFVDELPFFALTRHLTEPSRRLLLIECGLLAIGGYVLFYISSLYFLRKAKVPIRFSTLVPFLWLGSLGFPLFIQYFCPEWRGLEIGFSFLTFMLAARVLYEDTRKPGNLWGWVLFVLVALAIGVVTYSDPYYLYFTLAPIVLFSTVLFMLKRIRREQLSLIYGGLVLILIFSKLASLVTSKAGIRVMASYPSQVVDLQQLPHNILVSSHNLLTIFNADFFGRKISPQLDLGVPVVNFLVLACIIGIAFVVLRHYNHTALKPRLQWLFFFSAMLPLVFGIYAISTLADPSTYRYFFIIVFCSVTLLAIAIGHMHSRLLRMLAVGLVLLAITLNMSQSLKGAFTNAQAGETNGNFRNSENYALIDAVKRQGLIKGYANYWQANINTYLSKDTVRFLPVTCSPSGSTVPYYFLIDNDGFGRSAAQSFYIIDPNYTTPTTCSLSSLRQQFGNPSHTLSIGDKTVLIYNYDIASKMQR